MAYVLVPNIPYFQSQMEQRITLKYLNTKYQIALANWRTVYQLKPEVLLMTPEVYKGNLVYRAKGSTKRVSYAQIRNGLLKKKTVIKIHLPF